LPHSNGYHGKGDITAMQLDTYVNIKNIKTRYFEINTNKKISGT